MTTFSAPGFEATDSGGGGVGGPSVGTAFLRVLPDVNGLNARLGAYFTSSDWGKLGKSAGIALGAGIAAGGAVKALYNIGEAFDDAYDKIRVGTGQTGKDLGRLQKSFRDVVKAVPTDFGTAADAITSINQRLEITGQPLERLSKQFTELSRITETDVQTNIGSVTRAFGDWEVKTREQSEQLDRFFRASQASGASVSELADQVVQFGAPLRQVGFSLNQATAMFAAFEEAGVNTQTMMPGLRMALRTFIEEGTDPQKGLQRAFEDIKSGAMDSTEALEIFGTRAGPDMVEAIRQGRFDLDELTKSLKQNDETIRGAGRQTMDFAEQWQKFKNNVLVFLEPIATRVFEAFGDGMKELTRLMRGKGGFAEAISNAAESLRDLYKNSKLLQFVVAMFKRAFEGVKVWVDGLVDTLGGFAKFIGGVLTLDFKQAWEGIKDIFVGAAEGIAGAALAISSPFRELADRIGGWFQNGPVADAIRWLKNAIEDIVEKIKWAKDQIPDLNPFDGSIDDMVKDHDKAIDAVREWGDKTLREYDRTHDGVEKRAKTSGDRQRRTFDDTRRRLDAITAQQATDVADNVAEMVNEVGEGLKTLGNNTNKALQAFGAKKVAFSVESVADSVGNVLKKQRGGLIPGAGDGDKVHVMAEPGEGFINKKAVQALGGKAAIDAINKAVPRFQTGGLVQALGPYSIPPIQYDPNHAGGNSHLHLSFTSPSIAQAFARQIAPMGWTASEAPWAGGLSMVHQDPGHATGAAFDANTAQDETRAQVAAVARLLGSGSLGAASTEIARVLLKGPNGPLKDAGQGALDQGWKAAQAYVKSRMPKVTGGFSGGGAYKGPLDHDFGAGSSQTISFNQAAMLAEAAGLPGITYAQIAQGESALRPGAVSSDGGYGLWQMTPRVQSPATVAAWKAIGSYFNPWNNALMAKVLAGSGTGVSNYFGTGFVSDWNAHYKGNIPKFHNGGIFRAPTPGGEGLAVLKDRERVITDRQSPKVVINGDIIPHKGVSPDEVVEIFWDEAPELSEYTMRSGGRGRGRQRQLA